MPLTRLPSLSSLRAFEAAARRGSIKEAANELAVTPGAVSQQIKALEEDLGVSLFVRKTRAIQLTPEGQRMQPTISEAFQQIRQIVDQVRPKVATTLRITASNALIGKWLLPRLHRFTQAHPEIQVQIGSEIPYGQDVDAAADIEFRYASAPPDGMYSELMHREFMLLVASPDILERYGVERREDIRTVPILYDANPMRGRSSSSWDIWSKEAGLPDMMGRANTVTLDRPPGGQIVDAAIAGVGVAICGSLLSYSGLADGRLVCPFGPIVESGVNYYVCCPAGRENEAHVREFLDWAHKEAAVLTTLNAMTDASV